MADRARLVVQRGGSRGAVTRLIARMAVMHADVNIDRPRKIHDLRQKLADLNRLLIKIEDFDDQIFAETDIGDLEAEQDAVDTNNTVIRDARDLVLFQIGTLEAEEAAALVPAPPGQPIPPPGQPANPPGQPAPALPPTTRVSSRPKIQLPRFNGEILKWQSFWQAFDAEIHSDLTIANINKFNYLMGQLEPNVANTVAGLPPSNASYPELVKLLQERYGSASKITMAYMRALYGLPKPENSIHSLRPFYDSLESYVRGLEALGKAPDTYGDLLVCILLDKLPGELRKNLARQHDQDEWTLEELRKALRSEIRVLEAGQITPFQQQPSRHNSNHQQHRTTSLHSSSSSGNSSPTCNFCSGDHFSYQCTKYSTAEERWKVVKQKHLCFNCLQSSHQSNDCKSKYSCRVCRERHHSSLHITKNAQPATQIISATIQASPNSKKTKNPKSKKPVVATYSLVANSPFVFLKTAIVSVRSLRGKIKANVLLDEGSQRTFVTRKLTKALNIKSTTQQRLRLSGFAGISQAPHLYDVIEFSIFDRQNLVILVKAIVVDQVANPLDDQYRKALQSLPYLKNLDLAHPSTGKESFNVEILIGADYYWSIVGDETPIRGKGPTAIQSRVGYLVSGPLPDTQVSNPNRAFSLHVTTLEEVISRLWTLESVGVFPHKENQEEVADYAKRCIEYREGQYVARFPWKMNHPELPSNFNMVQNMTRSMIKRLYRDPTLFKFFGELIQQQLSNQFIELVPESQMSCRSHYIPYHFVKKDSSTTPIRIVYNCSCSGWNGVSFNDCVETGVALQGDQTHIMIRFRVHAIRLVADEEKALHHIALHEADRDFLRWLWLKDPTNPDSEYVVYRFKVVPFGAKSSPFILNSTVIHHLSNESSSIAKDMQNNIFVDNIISGCDTREEAVEYYRTANKIMEKAGLPLQAWGFSDTAIEQQVKSEGCLESSHNSKTLGFVWNRIEDSLSVQPIDLKAFCSVSATRRDVIRGVATLYDPLGYYAPLNTKGKILLQDLSKEKVPLDQVLPTQFKDRWLEIASSITDAVDQRIMTVPRPFFHSITAVRELHVFETPVVEPTEQ